MVVQPRLGRLPGPLLFDLVRRIGSNVDRSHPGYNHHDNYDYLDKQQHVYDGYPDYVAAYFPSGPTANNRGSHNDNYNGPPDNYDKSSCEYNKSSHDYDSPCHDYDSRPHDYDEQPHKHDGGPGDYNFNDPRCNGSADNSCRYNSSPSGHNYFNHDYFDYCGPDFCHHNRTRNLNNG